MDLMPRVTFCRPQIASVGLTEEEATGRRPRGQGRLVPVPGARQGDDRGRDRRLREVRRRCRQTGVLLGAHIIGPHAGDLLAEPTLARLVEGTAAEIAMSVHAHPTLTEVLAEAALAVDGAADPRVARRDPDMAKTDTTPAARRARPHRRRRARHVPRHAPRAGGRRADVAHAARRQDRVHHQRPGPRGRAGRHLLADAQGHRTGWRRSIGPSPRHDVRHERRGHHHRPPGQGR